MVWTGYEIDAKKPLKVIINGKEYDLTKWKNFHPGGHFILHQYDNKDATDVFRSFHGPEAWQKLERMSGADAQVAVDSSVAAFRTFRSDLEKAGWFEPSVLYSIYKASTTVGLVVLGCSLAIKGWWLLGAVLLGLGYQQLGWLGHDTCHHNFTKNRRLNNALSYVFGNLLNGLSVNWWKNRHNTHHAVTNVLDADPDVDNLPLFVWDVAELSKVQDSWLAPAIVAYQEWYFIPWTASLKIIWMLQSVVFLFKTEIQNESFRRALKWERLTIALHFTWVFLVAWHTPSWIAMASFLLISEAIGGAGIALVVFMNHYALDLVQNDRREEASFIELQLNGTRNILPNLFNNWFSGGLNLQIEHHLFPTMPRNNLLAVRPLVKEFCRQQKIPYQELSYWECLCEVERKLSRVSAAYQKSVAKKAE